MNLAPGVSFNPEAHEYFYRGGRLSGITGRVAQKLALKMPEEFVGEHQAEGVHVHRAVQRWIETGEMESLHPGARWIMETFHKRYPYGPHGVYAEVLVSDFSRYASSVDIVASYDEAEYDLDIYDIKTGVFKRDYVSWQLGVYKYLIEKYARRHVAACTCVCVKDREYYPVIPEPAREVERLLYG
jgi:hypothetical protein